MENLSAHEIISKVVWILIGVWVVVFVPLIIMIFLLLSGHGGFIAYDNYSWSILYYNVLFAPAVILISSLLAWFFLSKKKYVSALVFALVPFINVIIELVVADIALLIG